MSATRLSGAATTGEAMGGSEAVAPCEGGLERAWVEAAAVAVGSGRLEDIVASFALTGAAALDLGAGTLAAGLATSLESLCGAGSLSFD